MDRELFYGELVGCLKCAGILKAVAISRNLEGFRDAEGLRHLVRCWCPSLHTFFFSVGELIITLVDVVNNFLISVFGDKNPFDISLSNKDLKVEDKLFSHFSERTASPVSQDPQPMQTLSPTKTVSLEPMIEPALSKKFLGGVSSSIQGGESHPPLINMLNLISFIFSF